MKWGEKEMGGKSLFYWIIKSFCSFKSFMTIGHILSTFLVFGSLM